MVTELAARVLRAQGYAVLETAEEGGEALRLSRSHISQGFDLLFANLIMPLMNGSELRPAAQELLSRSQGALHLWPLRRHH